MKQETRIPEQTDGIILASYPVNVQTFSNSLSMGKRHSTSVGTKLSYVAEWLGSSLLEAGLILA